MLRYLVSITGRVQGVGFRPFVFNQAHSHNLKGSVLNTGEGVVIDIEGEEETLKSFFKALEDDLPPLAYIDSMEKKEAKFFGFKDFEILQSQTVKKAALVSPDIAVCERCLIEIDDKNNRRFNYALNNCVDCGVRYSILKSLPYDRENSSMASFKMCPSCKKEYESFDDRRYHAQAIGCLECGPKIRLYNRNFEMVAENRDAVDELVTRVKSGDIVAVKGIGGFHLMCDATNDKTVKRLREKKNRPAKPFALLFGDIKMVEDAVLLSESERIAILSKERPIVLLQKNPNSTVGISETVAPNIDRLGAMLSYTPLHHLIFKAFDNPLVVTSANLRGNPIITDIDELFKIQNGIFDYVLDYNREIVNACDDSVLQIIDDKFMMMRLSRGFSPKTITLPFRLKKKILAVGAQQKNSIALAFEDKLILSPHIGDLHTIESFEFFERTLETFERFYDFKPDIIVCDKHPGYETTKWAKKVTSNISIIEVQHHYAHLLACMAEHELEEKVLGFSFDGTGYGDDGTLWGGEVMIADVFGYERIINFRPFKMLGGEIAAHEPRRLALSMLFEYYDLQTLTQMKLPSVEAFTPQEIERLHIIYTQNINSPRSSSVGRLFDAIASLGGFIQKSSYEGESGLIMERYVDEEIKECFDYEIIDGKIELFAMLKSIILIMQEDMDEEKKKRVIASMFINTLVQIMAEISDKYPDLPIVISGGVFQNRCLTQKFIKLCRLKKRRIYRQESTPINDGGIALGQVYYAMQLMQRN